LKKSTLNYDDYYDEYDDDYDDAYDDNYYIYDDDQGDDDDDDSDDTYEISDYLQNYVLRKYYQDMDPIRCIQGKYNKKNGKDYCWVSANSASVTQSDDYADDLGAVLFPLLQHYQEHCYSCNSSDIIYDAGFNDTVDCNVLDIELLLYFNPENPTQSYYVNFDNSSSPRHHYHTWAENSANLNGLINLDFYGGIEYLNKFFYKLPNTHCTRPIALTDNECLTKNEKKKT